MKSRKNFLPLLVLLAIFAVVTPSGSALALGLGNPLIRPFGGKIISPIAPPVVCPGQGPISIVPAGPYPSLPYYAPLGTNRTKNPPTPGTSILGLYILILSPFC